MRLDELLTLCREAKPEDTIAVFDQPHTVRAYIRTGRMTPEVIAAGKKLGFGEDMWCIKKPASEWLMLAEGLDPKLSLPLRAYHWKDEKNGENSPAGE